MKFGVPIGLVVVLLVFTDNAVEAQFGTDWGSKFQSRTFPSDARAKRPPPFRQFIDPEREKIYDAYKRLGLKPGASKEEVKAAHRREALKWHPDKNKAPDAEERFKEVQRSFELLSDSAVKEKVASWTAEDGDFEEQRKKAAYEGMPSVPTSDGDFIMRQYRERQEKAQAEQQTLKERHEKAVAEEMKKMQAASKERNEKRAMEAKLRQEMAERAKKLQEKEQKLAKERREKQAVEEKKAEAAFKVRKKEWEERQKRREKELAEKQAREEKLRQEIEEKKAKEAKETQERNNQLIRQETKAMQGPGYLGANGRYYSMPEFAHKATIMDKLFGPNRQDYWDAKSFVRDYNQIEADRYMERRNEHFYEMLKGRKSAPIKDPFDHEYFKDDPLYGNAPYQRHPEKYQPEAYLDDRFWDDLERQRADEREEENQARIRARMRRATLSNTTVRER